MASQKNLEDLDLSQEEIKRISEALKDEKFRKMFVEYAEEISNPENRKRYEEEIAMMEQERGMDVQFVHPQPGYVLKTVVDGEKKAFVNISMNDLIGQPTSKKETDGTGRKGLSWQIPHSFSPPREDFDKNNKTCMVYDVVFHPDTFRMTNNPRFKKLVEDTAIEGIEKQFQCKLDRNNLKHPKLKYKGKPVATVIRTRKDKGSGNPSSNSPNDLLTGMPYPYPDKTSAELAEENTKRIEKREKEQLNKQNKTKTNFVKQEESGYTTPKYSIIHRGYLELQEFTNARDSKPSTRPKEIVVSIELPLCKSATGVELDIFEEKLVLKSEKPAYHLDLKLPYPVDDENGSAKFDKTRKSLIVTLPVVPQDVQSVTWISNDDVDVVTEDVVSPPFIEELSIVENKHEEKAEEEELPPLEDITDEINDTVENAIGDSCASKSPYEIAYSLPQYEYSQDKETVTFVFHVRNVTEESVSKAYPKQGAFSVKFLSLGSGGFPMCYSFYADFFESATLIAEHTTVDISDKNMTLTLLKGKDCRYIWNSFSAGLNDNTVEEKFFLTTDNLSLDLEQLQLDGERMGKADFVGETLEAEQAPHVEVTEMNKKKLTIKISEPKACLLEEDEDQVGEEDGPSSASIEIVHSTSPPELHSILKQRSVSESSEDHSSGSTGESPTSSSPRDGDCPKHVTFNSRVDRTTFKSNAATKSIKTTLKNKRRHEKKKEAKKEKSRRRRHNSAGSECSSCDEHDMKQSSESHSEDEQEDLSELIVQTGKMVEGSGVIEEEEEQTDESVKLCDDSQKPTGTKQTQRKRKRNRNKKNKLAEEVKSKMAELKPDDEKCDSDDDDYCVELDERTSKEDEVQNAQKDVNRTSSSEIIESSVSNDLNPDGDKITVMAANDKAESGEPANDTRDSGEPANTRDSGEPDHSGTSSAMKGDNLGSCDDKGKQKQDDGYHEKKTKDEGVADHPNNSVETELSWKEADRESTQNEHRTECAFKFSNAVMYDLDID